MAHRSIQQHIDDNKNELDSMHINSQRRRHLEDELDMLSNYQKNHPNEDRDPSSLELYCEAHPDALECKIYDN